MREQRLSPIERIEFDVDKNEFHFSLDSIQDLFDYLAFFTRSKRVNYDKIRRESRVRLRLDSSYFTEVFSVGRNLVRGWSRMLNLMSVPGLYSDVDVDKDKYEGGFKVWEGTCDLVKFLTQDEDVIRTIMDRESTLRVLELGAGAGLASLSLISRLVYDRNFKQEYRIHLQDYNWEVLATMTMINFAVNLPRTYLEALIHTKCLRFFFGDWSNFRNKDSYKYDLIMMSETLYNVESFQSLHDLLERHLRRNGYIVSATKDTYFGLSGGLYPWIDFVKSKGVFTHRVIKISTSNIPRSILILSRINN